MNWSLNPAITYIACFIWLVSVPWRSLQIQIAGKRPLHNLLRGRIMLLWCSLYSRTGALLEANFSRSLQLCWGLGNSIAADLPVIFLASSCVNEKPCTSFLRGIKIIQSTSLIKTRVKSNTVCVEGCNGVANVLIKAQFTLLCSRTSQSKLRLFAAVVQRYLKVRSATWSIEILQKRNLKWK